VQHDGLAGGGARIVLPQRLRDVFVREPMKSVAPHAASGNRFREREGLCNLGLTAVEGRIEARDLGSAGERSSSVRIGARLWGWCSGASGMNFSSAAMTLASTRTGAL
jgi:hypothetical protein